MMAVEERTVRKGYKMSELGEIPVEWEIVQLGDKEISKKITQGPNPKYNIGEATREFRVLKTKDLYNFGILYNNADLISHETFEGCRSSALENKDILIAIVGKGSIGKSNIFYKPKNRNYIFTRAIGLVRVNQDNLLPEYLHQYFQSPLGKNIFERGINGSTGQEVLQTSYLREIKLPLPLLKEQQKIAEILSTVDEQIENTEELIEKTKELKKGLMQQLLTRGIGHTEFKMTELGEIPVGWEIFSMESICKRIIVGIASSTTQHYSDKQNGVPIIRNQNIKENALDSEDLLYISYDFDKANSKKRLKVGDLLTVRTGYPGITAVVPPDFAGCQSFTTLISTPNQEIVNSDFIAYYLNSPLGKEELTNLSAGGAQQNLNVGSLSKYRIKLPGLFEQQKITRILSAVDEQIESYEEEKEKYTELKKGLMQQLLTGEIRVKA